MSRFSNIQADEPPSPEASPEEQQYDHDYYVGLAQEAQRRGNFDTALRYYGRALEQDREQQVAWLGQIEVLMAMGQPEEAETWLEQAAGVIGEAPPLLALRAIAAARSGKFEDAQAWSDRALRDGGDNPIVWLSRAEVLYCRGSAQMARVNLNKAYERAPGSALGLRCGEVALNANDLSGARPWLERAARDELDNPMAALLLGIYWERAGNLEQAKVELRRALALEPHLKAATLALEDIENRGLWSTLKATLRRWSRNE